MFFITSGTTRIFAIQNNARRLGDISSVKREVKKLLLDYTKRQSAESSGNHKGEMYIF